MFRGMDDGGNKSTLAIKGDATPAGGFVLRLPSTLREKVTAGGKAVPGANGDFTIPAGMKEAQVEWMGP